MYQPPDPAAAPPHRLSGWGLGCAQRQRPAGGIRGGARRRQNLRGPEPHRQRGLPPGERLPGGQGTLPARQSAHRHLCGQRHDGYRSGAGDPGTGTALPEEISLAVFDDVPFGEIIQPRLTTVAQPAYDIGYRGAELLISRIEGRVAVRSPVRIELIPNARAGLHCAPAAPRPVPARSQRISL